MNQTYFGVFLGQLLTQTPVLLVYLVGLILAAVWWRRAPAAAMLALAGCGILLLTTIGVTWLQNQIMQSRMSSGTPATTYAQQMLWIGVASSIIRAFATGLLVA